MHTYHKLKTICRDLIKIQWYLFMETSLNQQKHVNIIRKYFMMIADRIALNNLPFYLSNILYLNKIM